MAPAAAQGGRSLDAISRQSLSFGVLIAGTPSSISRFDALHAGQFELRGAKNSEVRIDLVLPAALGGPRGARLPLAFGAGDGGFSRQGGIATAAAFDPRTALITTLGSNGKLFIFLGGTAKPALRQTAGSYSASVTMTIAYTGT